jgi:hypothetical protein
MVLRADVCTQEEDMSEQSHEPRHGAVAPARIRPHVLTTVLIMVMLGSVLLHLLTLGALVQLRQRVSQQLASSADHLAQVRLHDVRYAVPVKYSFPLDTTIAISETVTVPLETTVPIKQTIQLPIQLSVPIKQTIQLPIQLSVPIKQTIQLPINTPLRRFEIPVPVEMTVPISETVTVPLETTVPVSATIAVPLEMTVPVSATIAVPIRRAVPITADIPIDTSIPLNLDLTDSPIGDLLTHLEDAVRALRNTLNE